MALHEFLHELFQIRYIHEILHLLSGCVGSSSGPGAILRFIQKRAERKS